MKLHEYQAKGLLAEFGVPVPVGEATDSPEQAASIASRLGGRAVVKAQIHAGGRGKAGGVKVGEDKEAVYEAAEALIGKTLVTVQTGARGAPVNRVLVEETLNINQEFYLSITTDGGRRRPLVIVSSAGGMEIEEVSQTDPSRIIQESVDPAIGLQPFQGRRLAQQLGIDPSLVRSFVDFLARCYRAYIEKDCSLIEINPLALTDDLRFLALDAKVTIDDEALFRHPEMEHWKDSDQDDPLETEAGKFGISYVKLDGSVGCMVNGAGLAMATMDTIKGAGAEPANFLDVGGGANEEKIARAITIMIKDPSVECVLVNIFGGILRCDIAARGIAQAYRDSDRRPPLVVRMLGTNVEEGKKILDESDLPILQADTLQDAARAIANI
jgi:succinyl-CoA synthetase beta subunit